MCGCSTGCTARRAAKGGHEVEEGCTRSVMRGVHVAHGKGGEGRSVVFRCVGEMHARRGQGVLSTGGIPGLGGGYIRHEKAACTVVWEGFLVNNVC